MGMPAPPLHKRTYLIDARFQLKYTGLLVGVVLGVILGLGVLIARTARTASDTAQLAVAEAERAMKESRTNSALVQQNVLLAAADNPVLAQVMAESVSELDQKAQRDLVAVQARRGDIERDKNRLAKLLVGGAVVLALLLGAMGILITNRVVGPVHKLKRLLRRVGTGHLAMHERLRKGDELSDLFDTFLQMTLSLKALQSGRLATLDATLRQAEAKGSPPEVLEGLRALRAQMVLGLPGSAARRRSSRPPPEPMEPSP
jgi:nitrogen fixation/metabolism regulation signal transduction histidine kinase